MQSGISPANDFILFINILSIAASAWFYFIYLLCAEWIVILNSIKPKREVDGYRNFIINSWYCAQRG